VVVKLINGLGVGFFTIALCWRIHTLARTRAGVQAVAITVAVAAMTMAPLLLATPIGTTLDNATVTGVSRVAGYAALALAVAGLAVAFFYGHTESARQRRAGIEAIPLVVAVVGLSFAMTETPRALRTASLDSLTVREVGLAVFFVIAGSYLMYGLGDCVLSLSRLLPFAEGHLALSLRGMGLGLGLAATGSAAQVCFIVVNLLHVASWVPLLEVSRWLVLLGIFVFAVGLSYPGVRAAVVRVRHRRGHRRDYQRLEPLWMLLTDAVPEVVLPRVASGDPDLRFQRRVIEIRDVLVQLSPYLPEDFGERDNPEADAESLRRAITARAAADGAAAPTRMVLPPAGRSIDAEAAPLLTLADCMGPPR
jgi:hypothetical protein